MLSFARFVPQRALRRQAPRPPPHALSPPSGSTDGFEDGVPGSTRPSNCCSIVSTRLSLLLLMLQMHVNELQCAPEFLLLAHVAPHMGLQ